MSNETDLNRSRAVTSEKEILISINLKLEKIIHVNRSKFDDFEVIASNEKFLTLIETLLTEVKKQKRRLKKI